MKLGIGIDTGGTCTDAVIYQFEDKRILAYGKTLTTKDNLSIGIGKALDQLPFDLIKQVEVVALSTTLATNACVENKGGRAKLVLFGLERETIARVGEEYGLPLNNNLIFINSKTKPNGEVVREPDWDDFVKQLHERFDECDAVGVVEMFAQKSGAGMEKKAAAMIGEVLGIPVVCGHSLFSESNIIKRGVSALLNARLLSVIEEFLSAVETALKQRNITAPFVIVRSDGSLMSGKFTAARPVETLLCGPVASVMGATELAQEQNAVIIDIGGTTTDIALVKNGEPLRVKNGIRIGAWSTFVKGLRVDTFGLGGDSGVIIDSCGDIALQEEKVMPLCMACATYPNFLPHLKKEAQDSYTCHSPQKDIYVRLKDISGSSAYNDREKSLASMLSEPKSLEELKSVSGEMVVASRLLRLVSEGVVIRCGVTPTDVMHIKGDFTAYDADASRYGLITMARILGKSVDAVCEGIYDAFRKKLYCNIVRILIEDRHEQIWKTGMGEQLALLIDEIYTSAGNNDPCDFLGLHVSTPAALVGVGAPTKIFLGDVGKRLGAKVITNEYSAVANALGAVVGKVSASVRMEVNYELDSDTYTVSGCGQRITLDRREQAEALAQELALEHAKDEVILRGADEHDITFISDIQEKIFETDYGSIYMGYTVVITASGTLCLTT